MKPAYDAGLARGEVYNLVAAFGLESTEIKNALIRLENLGLCRRSGGTAGEGVDTGEQLAYRERFGQIVVGTRGEAGDLVILRATGREHQNWQERARLPQTSADLDAVEIGQHEIEEHKVECLSGPALDRGLPQLFGDHIVVRGRQEVGQPFAKRRFILDDQYAHASA